MEAYREYFDGDIVECNGLKLKTVHTGETDGRKVCSKCYCSKHLNLCAYNGNPVTGYCCAKDRNSRDDIYFEEVPQLKE